MPAEKILCHCIKDSKAANLTSSCERGCTIRKINKVLYLLSNRAESIPEIQKRSVSEFLAESRGFGISLPE
jgi:hypothetical protein